MGCMSSLLIEERDGFDGVCNTSVKNTTATKDEQQSDDGACSPSGDRRVSLQMQAKRRRNDIFSESLSLQTSAASCRALEEVPKTVETKQILQDALAKHFLFCTIGTDDIHAIINLMQPKQSSAGEVVIQEGDMGDFFYVVESGVHRVTVHGEHVGVLSQGASFGELALIYNSTRAATITTLQPGRLWTLDRQNFRKLVASHEAEQLETTKTALQRVALFKPQVSAFLDHSLMGFCHVVRVDLNDENHFFVGAVAAKMVRFTKGEQIIKKGEEGHVLYIIKSGTVLCSDTGDSSDSKNLRLHDGDYFGERALMTREPRAANVTAETDIVAIALDRQAFDELLGSLHEVIDRNMSMRVLQSMPLLKNLSQSERDRLFTALETKSFQDGEYVIRQGERGTTFYIIKSGSASVYQTTRSSDDLNARRQVATSSPGNFFGEMALLHDEPRQADVIAAGKLQCLALNQSMFVELLGPLQDILNREAKQRKLALHSGDANSHDPGIVKTCDTRMDDLEVLRTIGSGTFARVKLVRHRKTGKPYALKVLNKAHVVASQQHKNVLHEKMIMEMCDHPFIVKLYGTFKDAINLYLLVEFVQGGDLFTYLHGLGSLPGKRRLHENQARFYASHVLMALEYLHEHNIVYRDLKPENLLMDPEGYLKLVDLGFAKIVTDRAYTLCGTPEYLAPELLLGTGHNKGVDYWGLGILIYEMVVGYSPFVATTPSDQMINIARAPVRFPDHVSPQCRDLILKLLQRDVSRRLGMTRGGASAIRLHPWFDKIDWVSMFHKRVNAPFRPILSDPFDASLFDKLPDVDVDDENNTSALGSMEQVDANWDAAF